MEFLDSLGLKYLINKMKTWVITKLGYFWGGMKLSRVDWQKTQWGFKAGIIDNAESELGKSPKLWLQTTDWMYSKWNEIALSNSISDLWFGVYTAPAQYDNLKDGSKYQNYYTNNIQVQPEPGNMKTKELIARKFVKRNGTANQVLMADGSTKDLNNITSNISIKSLVGIDVVEVPTEPIAYPISQSDYQLFYGNTSKNDMMFFQIYTSGTLFQRMNRYINQMNQSDKDNGTPRFYGDGVVLWATHENNIYYIVIADSEIGSTGGFKGMPDNVKIKSTTAYLL